MGPSALFFHAVLFLSQLTVEVKPRATDELLPNCGMGWQTFHCFASEDRNLAGLPSGCSYWRFYWKELEEEEGRIAFEKLQSLLRRARASGQKLAFRIMCAGTRRDYLYVPRYLREKGCRGFQYRYRGRGPLHWVPDMDDPIFKKAHLRFIAKLGERFDGHPDIDLVDIGSVGLWGEWHMSSTGVSLPSLETRLDIIEAYVRAFPKTPKVMLIGDAEGMKYALARGCGWRADCLGDMGGFSRTWCHMRDFYPQQIKKTKAQDAWKVAPVAFETCWDMRKWKQEGWDIRKIFDFALTQHASYVNNKSAPIPEGTRGEVERLLRRLGYRLVVRSLEHNRTVQPGGILTVNSVWENCGVAPPYHPFRVAFRLAAKDREVVFQTPHLIKGWLPGRRRLQDRLKVPKDCPQGEYELAVGVVDPKTARCEVRLALQGRTESGWYPVSRVEVKAEGR